MFNKQIYSLFLCALYFSSHPSDHLDVDGFALSKILERTQSFSADFSQSVVDSRGVVLENIKGKTSFKKPNLFKWNVQEPYEQSTVLKEEYVYIFEPELAQLTIQKLDDQGGPNLALLLSSGGTVLLDDFIIREEESYDRERRFVLTPKTDDVLFTSVVMNFSDSELKETSILDHQGHETRIVFYNVEINSVLESSDFDLEVPEGTDVIGDVSERDPAEQ